MVVLTACSNVDRRRARPISKNRAKSILAPPSLQCIELYHSHFACNNTTLQRHLTYTTALSDPLSRCNSVSDRLVPSSAALAVFSRRAFGRPSQLSLAAVTHEA